MTLIDYAKYLLSVCGRRFTHLYRRHYLDSTPALPSLSAILSYLKTQTASIYGYLQTRFAGDPTSGIPSITPTQPLTFANLLPNLQKLATRKIDAGASTQIPEGISLVRLWCDTTASSAVTELIDTNTGWTMTKQTTIPEFSNMTKLTIKAKYIENGRIELGSGKQLSMPELEVIRVGASGNANVIYIQDNIKLPKLKKILNTGYSGQYGDAIIYANGKTIELPSLERAEAFGTSWNGHALIGTSQQIEKVVFGSMHYLQLKDGINNSRIIGSTGGGGSADTSKLLHYEFGEGTDCTLNLSQWQPTLYDTNLTTFLTNFRQYLFLRLADRTATTALTLTLSSAVYTALTTETSTLAELGITTLTDKEQAAGITLATAYNTWIDTYRAAINWNITNAG